MDDYIQKLKRIYRIKQRRCHRQAIHRIEDTMRYGVTFNTIGQVIPAGLHIPQNLAAFPYVPHPLQLTGHVPLMPTLGGSPVAGQGVAQRYLFGVTGGTGRF